MSNQVQNQTSASAPSSPERLEHRKWIGGRAVTLLSHYWRDDDPVELTAAIGNDWATVLEGIPQEYINRACVAYLRDEPRRKPTPGEIFQRARAMIPRPMEVSRPMTREEREAMAAQQAKAREINPERKAQAEAILSELGIKKIGDVK